MQTSFSQQPRLITPSITCRGCGAELKTGKKFCGKCGAPVPPPDHPPVQLTTICPQCGTALEEGEKFCVNCGAQVPSPLSESFQAGAMCRRCGAKLKANKGFCGSCGAPTSYTPSPIEVQAPPSYPVQDDPAKKWEPPPAFTLAPPPPPSGQVYTFKVSKSGAARSPAATPEKVSTSGTARTPSVAPEGRAQELPLPPSSQPWSFQDQTTNFATQIITKLNASGFSTRAGLGALLARMIRATLLDKTIYREVAADGSLQSEAWKVMGLVILLSSIGGLILSLSFCLSRD